ncbi:hypothetical protein J4216_01885 [Candidatus Woesearchaeota archaeon]|nr:hypothetical protein [Candidatus Woesearchaeota archaeon]
MLKRGLFLLIAVLISLFSIELVFAIPGAPCGQINQFCDTGETCDFTTNTCVIGQQSGGTTITNYIGYCGDTINGWYCSGDFTSCKQVSGLTASEYFCNTNYYCSNIGSGVSCDPKKTDGLSCNNNIECSSNYCDPNTRICGIQSPNNCGQNAPCTSGNYCDTISGICRPGCLSNNNCNLGETCDLRVASPGICTFTCSSQSFTCPSGNFCDFSSGLCRPGCLSNSDCNLGETCDISTNICVSPQIGGGTHQGLCGYVSDGWSCSGDFASCKNVYQLGQYFCDPNYSCNNDGNKVSCLLRAASSVSCNLGCQWEGGNYLSGPNVVSVNTGDNVMINASCLQDSSGALLDSTNTNLVIYNIFNSLTAPVLVDTNIGVTNGNAIRSFVPSTPGVYIFTVGGAPNPNCNSVDNFRGVLQVRDPNLGLNCNPSCNWTDGRILHSGNGYNLTIEEGDSAIGYLSCLLDSQGNVLNSGSLNFTLRDLDNNSFSYGNYSPIRFGSTGFLSSAFLDEGRYAFNFLNSTNNNLICDSGNRNDQLLHIVNASCVFDSDCSIGEVCDGCQCVSGCRIGRTCQNYPDARCLRTSNPLVGQCLICQTGTCSICNTNNDCGLTEVCNPSTSLCEVVTCSSNNDCSSLGTGFYCDLNSGSSALQQGANSGICRVLPDPICSNTCQTECVWNNGTAITNRGMMVTAVVGQTVSLQCSCVREDPTFGGGSSIFSGYATSFVVGFNDTNSLVVLDTLTAIPVLNGIINFNYVAPMNATYLYLGWIHYGPVSDLENALGGFNSSFCPSCLLYTGITNIGGQCLNNNDCLGGMTCCGDGVCRNDCGSIIGRGPGGGSVSCGSVRGYLCGVGEACNGNLSLSGNINEPNCCQSCTRGIPGTSFVNLKSCIDLDNDGELDDVEVTCGQNFAALGFDVCNTNQITQAEATAMGLSSPLRVVGVCATGFESNNIPGWGIGALVFALVLLIVYYSIFNVRNRKDLKKSK